MTVLHLNSYYIDNHLYSSLYKAQDEYCEQKVYIPIKSDRSPENEVELPNTSLHFDKVIRKDHKFRFWNKIRTLTRRVVELGLHKNVDFVHAHNLCNDGVVAYQLKKKYGLKYIVAIRSTDVGLQYKLMYHRRPYIHKVLDNAERIVFISDAYRVLLSDMLPAQWGKRLMGKSVIIPNGVDEFWHSNVQSKPSIAEEDKFKLIYVGQIQRRKKVLEMIDTVESLNKKGFSCQLTLVGGAHNAEQEYFENVKKLLSSSPNTSYHGRIKDKRKLRDLYRSAHAFVMVSEYELFGLVYIEALTQGLPVLYKSGEGIDYFLKGKKVGVSVSDGSVKSISAGIQRLLAEYKEFKIEADSFEDFNWGRIASVYREIYQYSSLIE